MKTYIGTKKIDAQPMDLGEYNKYRGWTMPEDEDPEKKGYLVVYPDGYESWSPNEVFEEAYREVAGGCMNFGLALEAIQKGHRVARSGWNGKDMFIFLLPTGTIPMEAIHDPALLELISENINEDNTFEALATIRMWTVNAHGRKAILTGWLASQTDMLSDDWFIVK